MQPSVRAHRGRVFKLMGDGMLAEFGSVVDAANAAEAVQTAANARAEGEAEERRVLLRMGINLGDVVVDGSDLYGDGVNIAARLQEVAPVGGIAVSAGTYEYLRGKTAFAFADAGERSLKNIDQPVRIWLWPSAGEATAAPTPTPSRSSQPSIAVLPFQNLSSAPDAEFFADGMTEDVINALSKFRWLFVIARGTMFTFKSQTVSAADVADKLRVRYVLEDSVRQAAQRVRISIQLIDTEIGNSIWSHRFDRQVDDIFVIQDEITNAIAAALGPEIENAERSRIARLPPTEINVWLLYQQGLAHSSVFSLESYNAAIDILDRVRELDPNFAPAIAIAAQARASIAQSFDPSRYDELMARARDDADVALALDHRDSQVLWAVSRVYTAMGKTDEAVSCALQSIELNPNHIGGFYSLGNAYVQVGQAAEGIIALDKAIELSPLDSNLPRLLMIKAIGLFSVGRYEDCIETCKRCHVMGVQGFWTRGALAISQVRLGNTTLANEAIQDLYARWPGFNLSLVESAGRNISMLWREPFIEGLRELGVPEE